MNKAKYFLFIIIAGLFLAGCSESITDPNFSGDNSSSVKWLKLSNSGKSVAIESQFSASKLIFSKKGGEVKVNGYVGSIKMEAELRIPENAFSDNSLLITMLVDDQSTTATFSPSPYYFSSSLSFDLEYEGIDLSGVDPSAVEFGYLTSDGNFVKAEYDNLEIDVAEGILKVRGAKVDHFSRYGFVKAPGDE